MQISRAVHSPSKNIRITSKFRSRSDSKNVEKPIHDQIQSFQKEQNFNLSKIQSPSRKQSLSEKSSHTQIHKLSLIFGQNKNKKPLTLTSKENHPVISKHHQDSSKNHQNITKNHQNLAKNHQSLFKKCQNLSKNRQDFHPHPKQKVSWLKNPKPNSIIRHLMRKDSGKREKTEQKDETKVLQGKQFVEQELIKNDTQQSQITQKLPLQKSSFKFYDFQTTEKTRRQRDSWLGIEPQFTINITSFKMTEEVQTQTSKFQTEDKYFLEYMRMRQLKLSSFNAIQAQESKIKEILKSTVDFNKNYNDLVQAINNGPTDDRQKRICSLSKDLTNCQVKMNEAFEKVNNVILRLEQHIESNVHQINQRKASIFASIQSLMYANLFEFKKQRQSSNPTIFEKILIRAYNQLKILKELIIKESTYNTRTITKFNNEILQVKGTMNEYMNVHLENRALQYTLIKQIEKIPALMITIFGESKDSEEKKQRESQVQLDDRLKDYMSTKCEECYHMKKKVSFLQFQNQKIKPVFKSLEWLIRDCTKNQSCLSFL